DAIHSFQPGGGPIIVRLAPVLHSNRTSTRSVAEVSLSRCRFDAKECALLLLRQQVQETVGALAHVADPLLQINEQRFSAKFFHFLVENDAIETAGDRYFALPHPTDEDVAFPIREPAARVKCHPRQSDRRYPYNQRLLYSFAPRRIRDARA